MTATVAETAPRKRRFLPRDGWLTVYAVLYIAFLYVPVLFLPIFSVNTAATPKFPLNGFTWKWYEGLPHTPELLDAAWNSLIVGISTANLGTMSAGSSYTGTLTLLVTPQ